MSSTANLSYTAQATIWKCLGRNEDGILKFDRPVVIKCDYGMNARKGSLDIGRERVIKNTIWTEYGKAVVGDYLLIGKSNESDPISAGAEEIIHIQRFADTFERHADDYALFTGGD